MVHCIEQDSLSRRRSIYVLGKLPTSSENCVQDTIGLCMQNCPTPFNVQSARVVMLLGNSHQKFWNLVLSAMKNLLPADKFAVSKKRIDSFAAAHGTILFYEDQKALRDLKKQFPLYRKNMSVWTQQANGILQYMIWQALSDNDIGASLQHYNELIESETRKQFKIPASWKMVAQMPFGSIETEAGDKTILPLDMRFKVVR